MALLRHPFLHLYNYWLTKHGIMFEHTFPAGHFISAETYCEDAKAHKVVSKRFGGRRYPQVILKRKNWFMSQVFFSSSLSHSTNCRWKRSIASTWNISHPKRSICAYERECRKTIWPRERDPDENVTKKTSSNCFRTDISALQLACTLERSHTLQASSGFLKKAFFNPS